jgi:hypothetical protein
MRKLCLLLWHAILPYSVFFFTEIIRSKFCFDLFFSGKGVYSIPTFEEKAEEKL